MPTTDNSSPQNDSIIRLAADIETVANVSCNFISDSASRQDGFQVVWFLNETEIIKFITDFPGFRVIVYLSSTLSLQLTTNVSQTLLYLNDSSITCYPPGSVGGDVFGVFRTLLTRNG